MIRITTVSDSIYEFNTKEMLMRRINPTHRLKGDEYWVSFHGVAHQPQVGQPLIIFMEPLKPNWADTNVRMTTTISDIEEVK